MGELRRASEVRQVELTDAALHIIATKGFIEERSTAVGNQLGILRLVLSEQFLLALPKSGSARLAACVQKTRGFVLDRVREGQDSGELRADLPAETLAPIVMGADACAFSREGSAARRRDARGSGQPARAAPVAHHHSLIEQKEVPMKRLILTNTPTFVGPSRGVLVDELLLHHLGRGEERHQ